MQKGDLVYVIKWRYINKNLQYYIDEMIYSDIIGHYICCRDKKYKDKKFNTSWAYASTFSKYSNRVFETKMEAEKEMERKQKEHDIKKEIEREMETERKQKERKLKIVNDLLEKELKVGDKVTFLDSEDIRREKIIYDSYTLINFKALFDIKKMIKIERPLFNVVSEEVKEDESKF